MVKNNHFHPKGNNKKAADVSGFFYWDRRIVETADQVVSATVRLGFAQDNSIGIEDKQLITLRPHHHLCSVGR